MKMAILRFKRSNSLKMHVKVKMKHYRAYQRASLLLPKVKAKLTRHQVLKEVTIRHQVLKEVTVRHQVLKESSHESEPCTKTDKTDR